MHFIKKNVQDAHEAIRPSYPERTPQSLKPHLTNEQYRLYKLIWDRFYKTDLSRGKDKKGTGLGLSITKEIITAHDEHINVISTEGVGTEFIFSLPIVDEEDDY